MVSLFEICRRAETGPVVRESEFDKRIVPQRIRELVKEYDIRYDPQEPIPTDDSLADDVFEAGKELLLDLGMLCIDTSRRITVSEDEVKEDLRAAPSRLKIGRGAQAIEIVPRGVEERSHPWLISPPSGIPISEDLAVKIYLSMAKEPLIEGLNTGTIPRIGGLRVRMGTPLEIFASRYEFTAAREALRLGGKPGLPLLGGMTGVSASASIAAAMPGAMRKGDVHFVGTIPELKINYNILSKIGHLLGYGIYVHSGGTPVLGGIAGGPEGTAIALVANTIAGNVILQGAICGGSAVDILTGVTTTRKCLWINNLRAIAISRNTHLLGGTGDFAAAGPCTEMLLYEGAAACMGFTVSGWESYIGPLASVGGKENYTTGLEFRLACEVAYASAGMKRKDANDIVRVLLAKYEDRIRKPPPGKSFSECYDVNTVKPTEEWLNIYDKINKVLLDLGIPL